MIKEIKLNDYVLGTGVIYKHLENKTGEVIEIDNQITNNEGLVPSKSYLVKFDEDGLIGNPDNTIWVTKFDLRVIGKGVQK